MKTTSLIFLCIVGFLVIVDFAQSQQGQGLCDNWGCQMDCFEQGLHGECDSDDVCKCYNCIYRACRRHCIRQNQVGQCDENHCLCL